MARRKHDKTGRSRGEESHVRLYRWLLNTKAYKDLGSDARAGYTMLASRYNGSNNGAIRLSVREIAAELGIGKSTAAEALKELEGHGFIRCLTKGEFRRDERLSSEFILTEFAFGADLPTKDFMRWPDIPAHDVWLQERQARETRKTELKAKREASKGRKVKGPASVRPEVQAVPVAGQTVPDTGQTALKKVRSVPDTGQNEPSNRNAGYLQPDTLSIPVGVTPSANRDTDLEEASVPVLKAGNTSKVVSPKKWAPKAATKLSAKEGWRLQSGSNHSPPENHKPTMKGQPS